MADDSKKPITVKCRYPESSFILKDISPSLKLAEFQKLVHDKTGILPHLQKYKTGYPLAPLQVPDDPNDVEVGNLLPTGALLVIDRLHTDESSTQEETKSRNGQSSTFRSGIFPSLPSSSDSTSEFTRASAEDDNGQLSSHSLHDEDLDRAIAMSLSDMALANTSSMPTEEFEPGPVVNVSIADGSCLMRRFVDSDNSCLFTSVAYVMERNRLKGYDLREVIAQTVRANADIYNEAFLGRPNAEYCTWIVNPQHWGGEIELTILSQHYRRQIAVYDIQTTNCYVYGREFGFQERVMLVYDGIHYDALAKSPYLDAPEELDLTVFNPFSQEGKLIAESAADLVKKFNETNQFTNTATFKLRCDQCRRGFPGAEAAIDHQRVTGHQTFSEYR